ncbi:MAG: hypothetical protein PHI16_02390 [Methanocellales archaeon]|nr:hypothetical protein [Methanocellales archaeon]
MCQLWKCSGSNFCNDVMCPVQLALNAQKRDSVEYQKIRQTCVKLIANVPHGNFIIG